MNPSEVHESCHALQQQDFVFLHSSTAFSSSRNVLQPNHYLLYLVNVYLEMIMAYHLGEEHSVVI